MTLSVDVMVKVRILPFGTPRRGTVSGAARCVGPMMKLP